MDAMSVAPDDDRLVDLSDDDLEVLPDQTRDDTDLGWGDWREADDWSTTPDMATWRRSRKVTRPILEEGVSPAGVQPLLSLESWLI